MGTTDWDVELLTGGDTAIGGEGGGWRRDWARVWGVTGLLLLPGGGASGGTP